MFDKPQVMKKSNKFPILDVLYSMVEIIERKFAYFGTKIFFFLKN